MDDKESTNWIEKAHAIAEKKGGKCLSLKCKNTKTYLYWECKKDHKWKATYHNVIYNGSWCPSCSKKSSERIVHALLEFICQLSFESNVRLDFLKYPVTGRNLELDGYNEENNLAFEYQGIQHFDVSSYYKNGAAELCRQQDHDKFKAEKCEQLGIRLVVVTYLERKKSMDHLAQFILDQLIYLGCQNLIKVKLGDIPLEKIELEAYDDTIFHKKQYEKMVKIVNNNGYQLLTESYIGSNHTQYRIQCKKGHIFTSTGDSILMNREGRSRCNLCDGKRIDINLDMIKYLMGMRGWTFLDDQYIGCEFYHNYMCEFGHYFTISWDNSRKPRGCACMKNNAYTPEMYKKQAKRHNATIISAICETENHQMELQCNLCSDKFKKTGSELLLCLTRIVCDKCWDNIDIFNNKPMPQIKDIQPQDMKLPMCFCDNNQCVYQATDVDGMCDMHRNYLLEQYIEKDLAKAITREQIKQTYHLKRSKSDIPDKIGHIREKVEDDGTIYYEKYVGKLGYLRICSNGECLGKAIKYGRCRSCYTKK